MYTRPDIYLGTDDFAKLVLNSNVFVDKSLFVKEFLEDNGDVVLITRPRRWGKSLNMSMLSKFFAIEVDRDGAPDLQRQSLHRKLFVGGEVALDSGETKQLSALKIAQETDLMEGYQGQYPVISLGLKDVKGESYDEIVEKLQTVISELFKVHVHLLKSSDVTSQEKMLYRKHMQEESSEAHLQNSLYFLSELLCRHFQKPVYILIDEYDTPINSAYLKLKHKSPDAFKRVLELFRKLMVNALKSNKYLAKGLVTGILRVAKANIFSDLNNILEYTLLDDGFISSYGFTQKEIESLFKRVPTETTLEQIQYWYNGYHFGGEVLYNPWSIMCCLAKRGKLDYYWIDSGGTAIIDAVLLKDNVQEDLQRLTRGEALVCTVEKKIVFENLDHSDSLYSLLLFSGYLNYDPIDSTENLYKLSVPNHEVAYIYKKRILRWVEDKVKVSSSGYVRLARLLMDGKTAEFEETLQAFLAQGASFFQTGSKLSEVFYSGFMLCLLSMLSSYYRLESEYESGLGKPDVVLFPKLGNPSQALVLEYKVCKTVDGLPETAQAGLQQILDRDYASRVWTHETVTSILAVSLAFCGKQVTLASEVLKQ